LQIGQETVARVVNKTATNITLLESNYQIVRVTGAQGQRPKVDLALANNDLNSTTTLGLVTENILNNEEGFITTSGQVQEINTTGSLQGETWSDGDILYLSGTVAGRCTNIKPIAPIHTVIIGFVEYAHITQGKIFVKVDNGYELEELHNVSAIAPNNNEVLTYDTPTLLWKPKTITTILGYTPFQLPTLTSGSVLFSNGTTIAQDNTNFFWDDTNKRLGLGTITPQRKLDSYTVGGSSQGNNYARLGVGANGAFGGNNHLEFSYNDYGNIGGRDKDNIIAKIQGNSDVVSAADVGGTLTFSTKAKGGTYLTAPIERMRIASNGYVGIGTINPLSLLDVRSVSANGDVRVGTITNYSSLEWNNSSGSTIINSYGSSNWPILFRQNGIERMRIDSSGNVGIGATTMTAKLHVKAVGALSTDVTLRIRNSADTADLFTVNGDGGVIIGGVAKMSCSATVLTVTRPDNVGAGFPFSNGLNTAYGEFRWKDASGADLARVSGTGSFIIGGTTPNASSLLDITSTTKGVLFPRMTTTQKNAIATPASGLVVYDTTLGKLCVRGAASWETITSL